MSYEQRATSEGGDSFLVGLREPSEVLKYEELQYNAQKGEFVSIPNDVIGTNNVGIVVWRMTMYVHTKKNSALLSKNTTILAPILTFLQVYPRIPRRPPGCSTC